MSVNIVSSPRAEFLAGVRDTFPLIVGAIPFGIIFGAAVSFAYTEVDSLSPLGAVAMSLFVFAGSSQFIAAQLIRDHASIAVIILTTFVVNLRHALYSATLGVRTKGWSQTWMLPLAFWLTDETFAVVSGRLEQHGESEHWRWYWLGSSLAMYSNWTLCTIIGLIAGQAIPDARQWGLDFAMVVTFIGIVVPLLKSRPMILAAVVAGIVGVTANGVPNKPGLILAALAGVVAGVLAEQFNAQKSPVEQTEANHVAE